MYLFPELEYPITQHWLPAPSKRRSKRLANKIRFLVAHDTGNPGSTAAGNVKYYERTCQEACASAHLFVDDKQIIECVPALTASPEKAWHVRYNCPARLDLARYQCHANDASIGVEYCYGTNIKADEAYRRYVWVLAYACWKFHLDPAHDIIGHHLLDPGRKTDPQSGLASSGRSYAQLLRDVATALASYGGRATLPAATAPVAAWEAGPQAGTITLRARLNLRYGQPSRLAPGRVLPAGQQLVYIGCVVGDDIGGNDRWYALPDDEYCWSGGIVSHG
jgi:N-acetylmuramoyl-L-alanine amidase CwlA